MELPHTLILGVQDFLVGFDNLKCLHFKVPHLIVSVRTDFVKVNDGRRATIDDER